MDQPTTTKYRNPVQVGMYVMSATLSWSGASAWKRRIARSGAGRCRTLRSVVTVKPRAAHTSNAGLRHQAGYALPAEALAIVAQLGTNSRHAVGFVRSLVHLADGFGQHRVGNHSRTWRAFPPVVVVARRDL